MNESILFIFSILMIMIIIILIIILVLILKNKNNKEIKEDIQNLSSSLLLFNTKEQESSAKIEERTRSIVQALNILNASTSSTNKQIQNVFEKVDDMNNIMVNKKTRGNWGEYQLNNLLSIYAGESKEIYEIQYLLKNGYIADVALHLPNSNKILIIDSKFPAENYAKLCEDLNERDIRLYHSRFKQDIKKHIQDISSKYITEETEDSAVMFIPSEAIYFYLCSECSDMIDYAHRKHVLITSPTTLLGVVFTLINLTKDMNRSKNIKALEKEIIAMYEDALRLQQRLEILESSIERLTKPLKEVTTSTDKIINKIIKIHDGYTDE